MTHAAPHRAFFWGAIVFLLLLIGIASAQAETGFASWYANENHQTRRADGHRYNPDVVSCAHKTLKLRTWIEVTDKRTGRSIRCQVLDRGPYVHGRIVDLSRAAAVKLGIKRRGVARVRIKVVKD